MFQICLVPCLTCLVFVWSCKKIPLCLLCPVILFSVCILILLKHNDHVLPIQSDHVCMCCATAVIFLTYNHMPMLLIYLFYPQHVPLLIMGSLVFFDVPLTPFGFRSDTFRKINKPRPYMFMDEAALEVDFYALLL